MKILIIGLGSIAKKHIKALNILDSEVEIYALRSTKESPQYGDVINIFKFTELIEIDFDFAIISSPTSRHLADVQRCLQLDIPLLVEKPVFNSLEIGGILEEIKGTNTYVGCNLRFLESLQFVKKHVVENKDLKVNEVNIYFGSYLPDWRPDTNFRVSYSANNEMGGGVHLDLIHEIDYLLWILGEPKEVHKTLRSNSSLDISSIDYANYTLEYPNFVANIVLNYFRKNVKRQFEIVFNEYTIMVDLLKNEVYKNDISIFKSNQTVLDTYTDQMKYFIDNKSNKMFNDVEEAFRTLKICL